MNTATDYITNELNKIATALDAIDMHFTQLPRLSQSILNASMMQHVNGSHVRKLSERINATA